MAEEAAVPTSTESRTARWSAMIFSDFRVWGELSPGLATEDWAAVHLVDGQVYRVASWHPAARVCRVRPGPSAT
ncbi:MAG: hypothetical protein C4315_03465 [Chloroflexota bacterium]